MLIVLNIQAQVVGVGDIGTVSSILINPNKTTYFIGIGIKDGEFYYRSGFALLFDHDFYMRIKFAQEGEIFE